ncbi:sensor histidine kinase [Desulfonema magnum]|uniref:histidine kinase n=1 Tax=Desulfonema magnum TaxID=45655 RepID=A0A975GR16_9BACT|nr:hybrid sensor histidine kinase/response regulator [Desulfonema magnum]QTA89548.1 Two component system response regulator/histidine kinase [Desulfonema magnum]
MNRILVIDDEPSIRKALSMGLAFEGYEVDVAQDGSNGILFGHQKDYDVLIVDLSLPDINGLEVIREIKQKAPEIIPIIITGNGSIESSVEAIHLEVSDYLEKPLSFESVKKSIVKGLEKRELKRKNMREKLQQMLEIYMTNHSNTVKTESDTYGEADELSEIIATFVHQMNNPLMSISGSVDLLMNKLKDEGAVREYLANIRTATREIATLNKKIMKLGQTYEDEIEKLEIQRLLKGCLEIFNDLLFVKDISVKTDLNCLGICIREDRYKFEQIFKNLILNAIDSMDGMPEKELTLKAEVAEDMSFISVHIEDTGCGISSELKDKIFTPYFTNKENGTGLGLHVVQKMAKEMNFNIIVQSHAVRGSRFTVQIPVPK